ncbi:MAG: hypothetical protein Q8P27_01335, partial [Candidatus Peregrinibacteria bacterium]|nr:hypothetical protein [Candidatus Peregrinibacteria bacterium]
SIQVNDIIDIEISIGGKTGAGTGKVIGYENGRYQVELEGSPPGTPPREVAPNEILKPHVSRATSNRPTLPDGTPKFPDVVKVRADLTGELNPGDLVVGDAVQFNQIGEFSIFKTTGVVQGRTPEGKIQIKGTGGTTAEVEPAQIIEATRVEHIDGIKAGKKVTYVAPGGATPPVEAEVVGLKDGKMQIRPDGHPVSDPPIEVYISTLSKIPATPPAPAP